MVDDDKKPVFNTPRVEKEPPPKLEPDTRPEPLRSDPSDQPQPFEGKGKYRLLVPHVIEGMVYNAGTEVGGDSPISYSGPPSNQMEGIDEDGKAEVNKVHQKLYGRDAPWHDENHPVMQARREAAEAAEAQKEELKSEPVSHQQAYERGHHEYRGAPVVPPHLRVSPQQTQRGGDTSLAMGPATPNLEEADPRPTKPLQEQMPKEGAVGGGTQAPSKR